MNWDTSHLTPGATMTLAGVYVVNPDPTLHVGDMFTIEGQYRRRTFWEWLTRQTRELQNYEITEDVSA